MGKGMSTSLPTALLGGSRATPGIVWHFELWARQIVDAMRHSVASAEFLLPETLRPFDVLQANNRRV
jgi:hypothetical protein